MTSDSPSDETEDVATWSDMALFDGSGMWSYATKGSVRITGSVEPGWSR